MSKELEALECSDKTEDNIVERNVDCLLHNIENGHFIKCDVCDVNWHKGCMCCIEHLKNSEEINTIKQALIKSQKQEELLDILKKALSNIHIGIAKDSNDGVCCVIGLYNPEVDKMYMLFESHNSEIVNKAEQLKEWFNKDKSK